MRVPCGHFYFLCIRNKLLNAVSAKFNSLCLKSFSLFANETVIKSVHVFLLRFLWSTSYWRSNYVLLLITISLLLFFFRLKYATFAQSLPCNCLIVINVFVVLSFLTGFPPRFSSQIFFPSFLPRFSFFLNNLSLSHPSAWSWGLGPADPRHKIHLVNAHEAWQGKAEVKTIMKSHHH